MSSTMNDLKPSQPSQWPWLKLICKSYLINYLQHPGSPTTTSTWLSNVISSTTYGSNISHQLQANLHIKPKHLVHTDEQEMHQLTREQCAWASPSEHKMCPSLMRLHSHVHLIHKQKCTQLVLRTTKPWVSRIILLSDQNPMTYSPTLNQSMYLMKQPQLSHWCSKQPTHEIKVMTLCCKMTDIKLQLSANWLLLKAIYML